MFVLEFEEACQEFLTEEMKNTEIRTVKASGILKKKEGNVIKKLPADDIESYIRLKQAFSSLHQSRPLCLLYGPRQFKIKKWDWANENDSIQVVYHSLVDTDLENSNTFWSSIAGAIGIRDVDGYGLIQNIAPKKLFLILDERDIIFSNPELTSTFLDCLCSWKTYIGFYGFLGVGSYDLVNVHLRYKEYKTMKESKANNNNVINKNSPFNLAELVTVNPFTVEQMGKFLKLIEFQHNFTASKRISIMEYSLGAPGVFGSLIRFTIDKKMYRNDECEWNYWFKVYSFPDYLKHYNQTYEWFQDDLRQLNKDGWAALKVLLANQAIAINQLVRYKAINSGFEVLQRWELQLKIRSSNH